MQVSPDKPTHNTVEWRCRIHLHLEVCCPEGPEQEGTHFLQVVVISKDSFGIMKTCPENDINKMANSYAFHIIQCTQNVFTSYIPFTRTKVCQSRFSFIMQTTNLFFRVVESPPQKSQVYAICKAST